MFSGGRATFFLCEFMADASFAVVAGRGLNVGSAEGRLRGCQAVRKADEGSCPAASQEPTRSLKHNRPNLRSDRTSEKKKPAGRPRRGLRGNTYPS